MTQHRSSNKSPKANDFIQCLKSAWFLPLISLVLFFSYYVVNVIIETTSSSDLTNFKYLFSIEKSGIISRNFLVVVLFIISLLSAIYAFSFLSSKKKTNVYLSLAIDRKTLYWNRAKACLSMIFLSFFVPLLIDLIVNVSKFGASKELFKVFGLSVFSFTAISLLAFALGTIAIAITGGIVESVLAGTSLMFLPGLIISTVFEIFNTFLYGFSIGYPMSFISEFRTNNSDFFFLNPLAFFTKNQNFASNSPFYGNLKLDNAFPETPSMQEFFITFSWLILGVLLLILGNKLIRRKKVENIGIFGFGNCSNIIISSFFALFTSYMTSMLLNTRRDENKEFLYFVISVLSAVVVYSLVMIILTRNFKKVARGIVTVPVYLVVIASLYAVAISVGFGFTTRVPEKASVEKAYVSLPYSISFYNIPYDLSTPFNASINNQGYFNSIAGPFQTEKDMEKIIELNKLATEKNDGELSEVFFTYVMKDGSIFTRRFNMAKSDVQNQMLSLTDTDFGKEYLKEIFLADKDKTIDNKEEKLLADKAKSIDKNIRGTAMASIASEGLYKTNRSVLNYFQGYANIVSNDGSTKVNLNGILTTDEYKKLKENIVDDMIAMTYEQKYLNRVSPKAVITFAKTPDEVVDKLSSSYQPAYVPLYPQMTKTIAYLTEKGIMAELKEKTPLKAYVVSTQAQEYKDTFSNRFRASDFSLVHYFNPFAGFVEKARSDINYIDEIFALGNNTYLSNGAAYDSDVKLSGNAQKVVETVLDGEVDFIQTAFKKAKILTDPAQLNALVKASTPLGLVQDEGYCVLLEYDNFMTIMYLDKTQAPEFVLN